MNKSTKIIGSAAIAIVLLAAIGFAVVGNDIDNNETATDTSQQTSVESTPAVPKPTDTTNISQAEGRYTTYSRNRL